MPMRHSEDELARLAGTTLDRLREMVRLAIVAPGPDGSFGPSDIARVRIADSMDRAGIELDQVGSMIADGSYSTGWADILFPEPVAMSGQTLREATTELGLPLDLVHRTFTVGWQLPSPGNDEELRDDDLEMLRLFALMYHSLGGDAEIAFGAVRYLGDNIRRLSESQMRFFREAIEEPMIKEGLTQREWMDQISGIGAGLLPIGFRAVELLHRRHLESFEIEDIVTNTEIAMAQAGLHPRRRLDPPAIAFADLTDYTSFTEAEGDDMASRLADRFGELTTHTANHFGGRVVKLLGDGAMFHFPHAAAAARCCLHLVRAIPEAGMPTVHAGIAVGHVVFRDGDYFGRTVNLAARVASRAQASEVLGTESAMEAAPDVPWEPVGDADLKGIDGAVKLFRAADA
jgi:adenylate cyclase